MDQSDKVTTHSRTGAERARSFCHKQTNKHAAALLRVKVLQSAGSVLRPKYLNKLHVTLNTLILLLTLMERERRLGSASASQHSATVSSVIS